MRKGSLWKKTVSILLASAMVLTAVPVSASGFEADESQQVQETMEEVPMEGEDTEEDMLGAEDGFAAEEVPEESGFQAVTPEPVEGFSAEEPLMAGNYGSWFDGGDGTEEQPYLISTAEQLKNIYKVYLEDSENDYYYKLTNNIDLSTATPEYTVNGYASFAATMKGVLDGDGHTVSGAAKYQSLVGFLYGTVKNLTWHVEDAATLVATTCGKSSIENVTITGYVHYTAGQSNESPLLYQQCP
jgi:hypothetical protein